MLGRSLDELPPQTRRLLESIKTLVVEGCEKRHVEQDRFFFSRRELRESTGWSATQIKYHLDRLSDLEYIVPRTGRTGSAFAYELLIDAQSKNELTHVGLLDPKSLNISNYVGDVAPDVGNVGLSVDDVAGDYDGNLSEKTGTC